MIFIMVHAVISWWYNHIMNYVIWTIWGQQQKQMSPLYLMIVSKNCIKSSSLSCFACVSKTILLRWHDNFFVCELQTF